MRPQRCLIVVSILLAGMFLLTGCAEETADLKQKIAELEKKQQKQEKDLREFAGKFAPPKDFSADIQRIEDQQERISQVLKTKVDPVNNKLEEFRDWAQDAQKDRDTVGKKLQALEQSLSELQKKLELESRQVGRIGKDTSKELADRAALYRKDITAIAKRVDDVSKTVVELRKELHENNAKLIEAVKKTLPKVKEAAVADLKELMVPVEKSLSELRGIVEHQRKTTTAGTPAAPAAPVAKPSFPAEPSKEVVVLTKRIRDIEEKEVAVLTKRIRDLEEIVTAQKGFLLEMGSKVHELEARIRRASSAARNDYSPVAQ